MASVVAALVLLVAPAQHVDSGVKGVVTIGPTCPVQRVGDPSCDDKPYQTTLNVVRARDGRFVKRFESRSDGRFRIHLLRGRYVIKAARRTTLPRLSPVPVKVERHRFTTVAIQFDSGIR